MIAFYLSPVYILVNIYIIRWMIRWMGTCSHLFQKIWTQVSVVVLYTFFASAILVGFLLPEGKARRIMKLIGNYWLGVMLYVVLTVVVVDLGRILLRHCKWVNQGILRAERTFVVTGAICIVIIMAVSIWGVVHAGRIHTTKYEVTVDKDAGKVENLHIVLAADLHLGYNVGCYQMKKMVDKINRQEPDLVVIAGDIFDNEYEALDNPDRLASILRGIKSKYGVYACYGNHDIEEPILAGFTFRQRAPKASSPQMDAFLSDAGIQLLRDEGVLLNDSFYLYGRADAQRPGAGISERKSPQEITQDMDKTRPIIVIDHQPRELAALAAAGVDIDLCGHTHDGQMFPGNLIVRPFWENFYGYLQKGSMHNIVTSGVGLFGPNMRVGTKAEICSITVHFSGSVNAQETTD